MGELRRLVMRVTLPVLLTVENRIERPEQYLRELGVRRGMRIVDVGCGLGIYTFPASRLVGSTGMVYAIDRDADSISVLNGEVIARRISNVKPLLANAVDTGLKQSSVELALLIRVFHDISDKPRVVEELRRILRPDGTIAIDDRAITPKESISTMMITQGFKLYKSVGKHGLVFAKTHAH
jgi:ubiquinone/menaquinone biosynthesis C-methylase UbiE